MSRSSLRAAQARAWSTRQFPRVSAALENIGKLRLRRLPCYHCSIIHAILRLCDRPSPPSFLARRASPGRLIGEASLSTFAFYWAASVRLHRPFAGAMKECWPSCQMMAKEKVLECLRSECYPKAQAADREARLLRCAANLVVTFMDGVGGAVLARLQCPVHVAQRVVAYCCLLGAGSHLIGWL